MNYKEAIALHKQLHDQDEYMFAGYSLAAHIPNIANIIKDSNIKTLLDYGCGKALGWKTGNYHNIIQLKKKNIQLYDPCVEEFSKYPAPCDMLVCIDVMEHILEQDIDNVLNNIFMLATKVVYFSISYRPATKILPNGMNAHLTVKPEEWWAAKIKPYSDRILVKGINID